MGIKKENLTTNECEQEVEFKQLEFEDFISGSENGLDYVDKYGNMMYMTIEDIQRELDLDNINEVYYIQNKNTVKMILNNGSINYLIRV